MMISTNDLLILATLFSGISGLVFTLIATVCELTFYRRDASATAYIALACFAVFAAGLLSIVHLHTV